MVKIKLRDNKVLRTGSSKLA